MYTLGTELTQGCEKAIQEGERFKNGVSAIIWPLWHRKGGNVKERQGAPSPGNECTREGCCRRIACNEGKSNTSLDLVENKVQVSRVESAAP